MTRLTLGFLAFLVSASFGFAQEPDPTPKLRRIPRPSVDAASVERLVKALGADSYQQRERALTDLRKLGPAALPHLRAHLEHPDPEVRTRIRSLVKLHEEPAEEIPEPTPGQRDPEIRRRDPGGRKVDPFGPFPRPGDFGDLESFRRGLDAWFESQMGGRTGLRIPKLGAPGENDRLGLTLELGPGGLNTSFSSTTTLTFEGEQLTWKETMQGCELVIAPSAAAASERTYRAKDVEDFKRVHPDVYERYKSSGMFERRGGLSFRVLEPEDLNVSDLLGRLERILGGDLDGVFEDALRGGRTTPRSRLRRLDRPRLPREAADRLGVLASKVPANRARPFDAMETGADGVWISRVDPGSLAEKMGLRVGDIVVSLNGAPLDGPEALGREFLAVAPGGKIDIKVFRDGLIRNVLGKKPGAPKKSSKIKKL